MASNTDIDPRDGFPSFVKTWRQMYTFVIGSLLLVMMALYLFMQYFK